MNLPTSVAVHVLTTLESEGYLKQGTRFKDETLIPKVAEIVRYHIREDRKMFAAFCTWWAEVSHEQHRPSETCAPFVSRNFWHCTNPMCLSLIGTIYELNREVAKAPNIESPLLKLD